CQRAILLKDGYVIKDAPVEETIHEYLKDNSVVSAEIKLDQRKDRQGNGKIKITQIRFENFSSEAISILRTGQDVRIIFNYETDATFSTVHDVIVSFPIMNQFGETFLNMINLATGNVFKTIPSKGQFILEWHNLPLMPGTYYFNTFVSASNVITDWIIDAGCFEVEYGDFFGSGQLPPEGQGNVLLKHDWLVRDL
ncbi:MAG: Wzt carbohydrate-binding domain-containing protein, partial [Patescibacteria group bacterium]